MVKPTFQYNSQPFYLNGHHNLGYSVFSIFLRVECEWNSKTVILLSMQVEIVCTAVTVQMLYSTQYVEHLLYSVYI